jgi:putative transcriptional regulator
MSPASRGVHAAYEAVGGALLDEIAPATVDPAALNRALRLLDAEPSAPPPEKAPPARPAMPAGVSLPASLARRDIGGWRWIAPGVRSCSVTLPKSSASRAFLLEIAPGVRVPHHGHEGDEMTCVLRGSFRDGETRYAAGDVSHVDASTEHEIVVDSDVPCVCLIAIEGRTRPSSWFGRVYQKLRDL